MTVDFSISLDLVKKKKKEFINKSFNSVYSKV